MKGAVTSLREAARTVASPAVQQGDLSVERFLKSAAGPNGPMPGSALRGAGVRANLLGTWSE